MPCILSLSVSFGVVDVLCGKIDSKTVGGHFKFMGCVSVGLPGVLSNVTRAERREVDTMNPRTMHKLMIVCKIRNSE